ncbi:hypothetical protein J1614_008114 [Plenodomus biglobosus]|nr:hypothetical protein J1614_008114 [Plenodomus biglobosus]
MSEQHAQDSNRTKSGVSTSKNPLSAKSQFDKGEMVKMVVRVGGYTKPEKFIVREKQQDKDSGEWEYQLNKESGGSYMGDDWFSESEIADV